MQTHKIPLAAKVAGTAFLAVLVPVYLSTYGPTNFLWFCDAALILTVAGMWLESPLLISMCAVGILLPQCLWLADFGSQPSGVSLSEPDGLYVRSALFAVHARAFAFSWLAAVAARLARVSSGLRKTGFVSPGLFCRGVGVVCYFFTPPAGAHLANANAPININYLYGFNDLQPQHWINQNLYVILWLGALWLVAFLPTHLALRKIFAAPMPLSRQKTTIRFLNSSLPASQDWIH